MRLSDLELEVMQFFWETTPLSTPEVYDSITKSKDLAYTTVKTIVDRLEEKGAIERVGQEGRTIFYRPIAKRSSITKDMVKTFVNKVFQGDSSELMLQLLKQKKAKQKDVEYVMSLLKDKRK